MKIGVICEDGEQRAVVEGLIRRGWCPNAVLELGEFKGMKGRSLRRELPKALWALRQKDVQFFVVMTDADNDNWQTVRNSGLEGVSEEYEPFLIFGVPDRNVECWVVADRQYFAGFANCRIEDLSVADPEMVVKRRLLDAGWDSPNQGIVALIESPDAPIPTWIESSSSFAAFYEDCRDVAQRNGCHIPNERERR